MLGAAALVVLLVLGVPAIQSARDAYEAAAPESAALGVGAGPSVASDVDPAAHATGPVTISAGSAGGSVVPAAPATSPAAPQAARNNLSPTRPVKANSKAKAAASKKPDKNVPVTPAPEPVVVPVRDVPLPVQTPPAVSAVAVPAAPALGPTFEAAQVDVRPRVESQVAASVPDHLRGRPIQDVVVLRVRVSTSGRPAEVQVLRRSAVDASLDGAAVAAVKQWRFSPARRRGESVNCWLNVGVPIRASGQDGTH